MPSACPKCGGNQILSEVPVVAGVDRLSAVPVAAMVHTKPDAWVFKGPVAYRMVARVCGECGFAELYVEDPQGLAAAMNQAVANRGVE